ncbi:MAG: response regulator transcription factor, partial [Thermomicrobiales bacterium]|nr:response regulator transcription factor [Thermomicrobiales bacterium]
HELPNLRLAFAWLLESGQPLRLLEMLTWTDLFWTSRVSHRHEVRQWVTAGLEAAPEPPPRLLAGALHLAMAGASTLGDHTTAITIGRRAVRNGTAMGDAFILGRAVYSLGIACEAADELEQAREAYVAAVAEFRRIPPSPWTAAALAALGDAHHWCGDPDSAAMCLDEALALYQQDTQLWGPCMAHALRGHVALSQGNLQLASRMLQQCLALEAQLGNECLALAAIAGAAGLALRRRQPERAARLLAARVAALDRRGLACVIGRINARNILDEVRAAMPETTFAVAWQDGLALTLAEARAEAGRVIASRTRASPRAHPHDLFGLTRRESEVLALMAQGYSDREISERLLLGRRTIQTHVAAIFGKLNVANRTEATAAAIRAGLV